MHCPVILLKTRQLDQALNEECFRLVEREIFHSVIANKANQARKMNVPAALHLLHANTLVHTHACTFDVILRDTHITTDNS